MNFLLLCEFFVFIFDLYFETAKFGFGLFHGFSARVGPSIAPYFRTCIDIVLQEQILRRSDEEKLDLEAWMQEWRSVRIKLNHLNYISYEFADIPDSTDGVPILFSILLSIHCEKFSDTSP